ncbi:MAG: TusE/DsrC/DsvC family sulfur relay protein [Gammaproteobacteria bacterium]|nr:TusE/DsrC/DsvC family sulfur relay protein [Gammaproteobacteria bacterium]
MQVLKVDTVSFDLTTDGRLKRPDDWNEDVAIELAHKEGLALTDNHWEVIKEMREYYQKYNRPPIRKLLKRSLAEKYGPDKAEDEYLQTLFPNEVLVQGTRIAGLPVPVMDAELNRSSYATTKNKKTSVKREFAQAFDFEGKSIEIHPHGNLVNLDDWNEQLAEVLAEREGITLTSDHWEVIRFLRKFYFEFGIAPMVKLLMKHMRQQLGDEKSSRDFLYSLFPEGPARQGSLIGGLPEPQGCIDAQ